MIVQAIIKLEPKLPFPFYHANHILKLLVTWQFILNILAQSHQRVSSFSAMSGFFFDCTRLNWSLITRCLHLVASSIQPRINKNPTKLNRPMNPIPDSLCRARQNYSPWKNNIYVKKTRTLPWRSTIVFWTWSVCSCVTKRPVLFIDSLMFIFLFSEVSWWFRVRRHVVVFRQIWGRIIVGADDDYYICLLDVTDITWTRNTVCSSLLV